MGLTPLKSLFPVMSVTPRKTHPAQSQMSHTPFQMTLAASPLPEAPLTQIPHQFPAIPDEMVSVFCSAALGAHPDQSIHNLLAPVFTLSHLLLLEQFLPQPTRILCLHKDLL